MRIFSGCGNKTTMATLKLILDQRRTTKSNTYALLFRITVGTKKRDVNSGLKLEAWQFNSSKGEITHDPNLNFTLQNMKLDYQKKLNIYSLDNPMFDDIDDLQAFMISQPKKEVTISSFWEEQIATLNSIGRTGNAKNYRTSLNVIQKHLNLNRQFQKLAYKDLLELEVNLLKRGMTTNGISVYMRAFKAIYNKAINLDIVGYDSYPFRKFKIKKTSTTPRMLSLTELRSYFDLNIKKDTTLYKAWVIGKLIFMMRGINLRDLLLLNTGNIKNGRVIYRRAKTKKIYSIPLLPEIERELNGFTSTETCLLGQITEHEMQDTVKFEDVFGQKRKLINAHLKKLGKLIGTNEPITTYVFRYSFSNISKQMGYSKDLISEALGHNYGNSTTSTYLEQFHQDELDNLTKEVVKTVM